MTPTPHIASERLKARIKSRIIFSLLIELPSKQMYLHK